MNEEIEAMVDIPEGYAHLCETSTPNDYVVAYYDPNTELLLFNFTNQIVGPITLPQLKLFAGLPEDIFLKLRA